nr:peptidyl-tRNA hydrolase [Skermania piniformis]
MPDPGFAVRHAELAAGYGSAPDPADPAQVLAMPVVLHLPKSDPPPRSALLAAAATAVVGFCLDERVGPGGPWRESFLSWKQARIRKVARRARGAHWTAVEECPGVSATHAGATARALVPGPVGELDARVRRLQIGGTDLPADRPGLADPALPTLWVNGALGMTVGKAAAQVGHASMLLAGALPVAAAAAWADAGYGCAVRDATGDRWTGLLAEAARGGGVAVRDAGFTEVVPGSVTVVAIPLDI